MHAMNAYVTLIVLLLFAPFAQAADRIARDGLLIVRGDSVQPASYTDAELHKPGMVCIRHNNYWCIKSVGWDGEIGKDGRGHAIFEHPSFAARAVARQLHTWWFKRGIRTAFDIMSRYAPPDDCIGSIGKPPDCPHGINPTEEYAKTIAASVGKTSHENLELFSADGKMNRAVGIPLIRAIARFELPKSETYHHDVRVDLIDRGISMAGH